MSDYKSVADAIYNISPHLSAVDILSHPAYRQQIVGGEFLIAPIPAEDFYLSTNSEPHNEKDN